MQWERVPGTPGDADTPGGSLPSHVVSPISPMEEFSRLRPGDGVAALQQLEEDEEGPDSVFDPHAATRREEENRFHISARRFPCCQCINRLLHYLPKQQVRQLLALAGPNAAASLAGFAINSVNLSFVGHLSASALAGAALGNSFMNITGYSVMIGMCSSIDTLCSQSYGAGQKQLVGLVAQRAAVAYTFLLIPIIAIWLNTERIFIATGQDPDVSALAGTYVMHATTTILPSLYCEVIKRFLQAQGITTPQLVISILANILHFFLCWLLMLRYELGLIGAPIAYSLTWWSILCMYLIYIRFLNRKVWLTTCPSLACGNLFTGWRVIFALGFPGMLMVVSEWASFELTAVASGWIGTVQLDTLVVVMNVEVLAFMFPLAIGISASTLIGNSLGANKPAEAKLFARATLYLGFAFILIELVVVGSLRGYLARVFTNDESVVSTFHSVIPLLIMLLPFDCIQGVQGGVIRGAGHQELGAKTNIFSYYAIGMPIGFLLAFKAGIGLPGLMIGLILAVCSSAIIFTARLGRVDWTVECQTAQRRIEAEHRAHNDEQGRETNEDQQDRPEMHETLELESLETIELQGESEEDSLAEPSKRERASTRSNGGSFDEGDDSPTGTSTSRRPTMTRDEEVEALQQSLHFPRGLHSVAPTLPIHRHSVASVGATSPSAPAHSSSRSRTVGSRGVFSIHRDEENGMELADAEFELDQTEDGLNVEERLKAELGIDAPPDDLPPTPLAPPPQSRLFVPPPPPPSKHAYVVQRH